MSKVTTLDGLPCCKVSFSFFFVVCLSLSHSLSLIHLSYLTSLAKTSNIATRPDHSLNCKFVTIHTASHNQTSKLTCSTKTFPMLAFVVLSFAPTSSAPRMFKAQAKAEKLLLNSFSKKVRASAEEPQIIQCPPRKQFEQIEESALACYTTKLFQSINGHLRGVDRSGRSINLEQCVATVRPLIEEGGGSIAVFKAAQNSPTKFFTQSLIDSVRTL